MRRSSPTHATGERAHPHPLFLELPSQLYWIINEFPVCSCSRLWDFHSFPSYSYPSVSSHRLSPHHLLFFFATLSKTKKPLSYGPASPADDEEYLQSQLSFGLILHLVHRYLLAFFLVRNFAKMRNLKMLCGTLKGFFWENFKKIRQKSRGKRLSSPGLTISSYRW
jgi:hypothetical protein